MYCILIGHELYYEVQTITQLFYPNESFQYLDKPAPEGITVESVLFNGCGMAALYIDGLQKAQKRWDVSSAEVVSDKIAVSGAIFSLLVQETGVRPPWGILTGVRPTKIVYELWKKGLSNEEAAVYMEKNYLTYADKAKLCVDVAMAERSIVETNHDGMVSLYIGIPFCASQCLYCSFTSYNLLKYKDYVDDYLLALEREMKYIRPFFVGRILQSIYIGGGTPTSLNESQLDRLLSMTSENFNTEEVTEYSVEAGRADTITPHKLRLMKEYGVSRISINPQTMSDATLIKIGRRHTVSEFIYAFEEARSIGHKNINVDLIVGLPDEGVTDVTNTMEGIIPLSPENITVHTLAVKRASRLKTQLEEYPLTDINDLTQMQAVISEYCGKIGMKPYYMYRQKNMLGNLENVGYCKEGYESIYNVQIMEERQTILGLGAGATSKLVDTQHNKIERIVNVKGPDEYVNRLDEMLGRKAKFMIKGV